MDWFLYDSVLRHERVEARFAKANPFHTEAPCYSSAFLDSAVIVAEYWRVLKLKEASVRNG